MEMTFTLHCPEFSVAEEEDCTSRRNDAMLSSSAPPSECSYMSLLLYSFEKLANSEDEFTVAASKSIPSQLGTNLLLQTLFYFRH